MATNNVEALANLLATIKENPEFLSVLTSENPEAELSKIVEEAENKKREANINTLVVRMNRDSKVKAADVKKFRSTVETFAKFVQDNVRPKEENPFQSRWHMTLPTAHGKITVSIDTSVTSENYSGRGRKSGSSKSSE